MSWRQQKHQCLCFHYWDFLTNFWRNNWRSIFDVVEWICYCHRLCNDRQLTAASEITWIDKFHNWHENPSRTLLSSLLHIRLSLNWMFSFEKKVRYTYKSDGFFYVKLSEIKQKVIEQELVHNVRATTNPGKLPFPIFML